MPNWDLFYKTRDVTVAEPVAVLKNNIHLLHAQTTSLKALDFACGFAANGRFLASLGYQVSGWDYSAQVVKKLNAFSQQQGLSFQAYQHDLENEKLPAELFDVIVVSHFLNRKLSVDISNLLKPGGLLFYQTFSGERKNEQGPSNPNFRLKTGELLSLFADLQTLYYREDNHHVSNENSLNDQAMLVAVK